MDGREVNWTTDLTAGLTSERKFSFLNVPKDCHIAMIYRGDPPEAFLWQYSRAGNWNAMLAMFPQVTNPKVSPGHSPSHPMAAVGCEECQSHL